MKSDWNTPEFTRRSRSGGFQEVWYLKLNDALRRTALWLRFTLLQRTDHSKEVAEVWAVFFDASVHPPGKTAVKNTFPLARFASLKDNGFSVGKCGLYQGESEGVLRNGAESIRWHIRSTQRLPERHDFVPECLKKTGLVKNMARTVYEDLLYTGWCEVNGRRYDWEDAPGMQGHLAGPRNGHSWGWGHCNCFLDEQGNPAPVIWDGLCARARLGTIAAPPLNSMFFQVEDKAYHLNTLRDAFSFYSQYGFEGWHFRVKKKKVLFEGRVHAGIEAYAGIPYEDTDGSLLYCHNTKIADMILQVIFPDGRKRRYVSHGAAAFEFVARSVHPDVPLLI